MNALRPLALLAALLAIASPAAHAKPWWMRGSQSNENDFLAPDVAFRVSSQLEGNTVRVRWNIADGYYLYRQRMEISAESPDLTVSAPTFPTGSLKTDPYLGTQEIYTQQVSGSATYTRADGGAHPVQIKVVYQGCAEGGLCYPPISKVLYPTPGTAPPGAAPSEVTAGPNSINRWEAVAIFGGGLAFFLAGLVLRKGRRLERPA